MDIQTLNWLTETIQNTQDKDKLINILESIEWMQKVDKEDETYQKLVESVNQKLSTCNT